MSACIVVELAGDVERAVFHHGRLSTIEDIFSPLKRRREGRGGEEMGGEEGIVDHDICAECLYTG